jgi:hypothetical protein
MPNHRRHRQLLLLLPLPCQLRCAVEAWSDSAHLLLLLLPLLYLLVESQLRACCCHRCCQLRRLVQRLQQPSELPMHDVLTSPAGVRLHCRQPLLLLLLLLLLLQMILRLCQRLEQQQSPTPCAGGSPACGGMLRVLPLSCSRGWGYHS